MGEVLFKAVSVFKLKYSDIACILVFRPILITESKVYGLAYAHLPD